MLRLYLHKLITFNHADMVHKKETEAEARTQCKWTPMFPSPCCGGNTGLR